jgi:hypothetical protein
MSTTAKARFDHLASLVRSALDEAEKAEDFDAAMFELAEYLEVVSSDFYELVSEDRYEVLKAGE